MLNRIRYRILMRRLRGEIANLVNDGGKAPFPEKRKTAAVTACKVLGSIV